MKDDEDGIIDLIFYCVGCNIVDILGMVGEFTPLHHFILKHFQWQIVIYMLSFFSPDSWSSRCWSPCQCILWREHWGALHTLDARPSQAQDWFPQVSFFASFVMWGKNKCVTLQIVEFLNLKVPSWVFMGIKIRAIVDVLVHVQRQESVTKGYYI